MQQKDPALDGVTLPSVLPFLSLSLPFAFRSSMGTPCESAKKQSFHDEIWSATAAVKSRPGCPVQGRLLRETCLTPAHTEAASRAKAARNSWTTGSEPVV